MPVCFQTKGRIWICKFLVVPLAKKPQVPLGKQEQPFKVDIPHLDKAAARNIFLGPFRKEKNRSRLVRVAKNRSYVTTTLRRN